MGRAEVSLTIDNASGKLPIDLAEVTITRTLFRSGDSEYAINGAPCRLLDIQELLSDSGVGRLLKLEQRVDALARGIKLVEWTFDPLEIKNAFFNIERLGAIVRRFVLNQYGTTSSPLNAGLPTDRCTAEWWFASDRVTSLLAGREMHRPEVVSRISIANDIYTIKANDFARARDIQKRVADQFLENFAKNLAVTGFERSAENGTYLFSSQE